MEMKNIQILKNSLRRSNECQLTASNINEEDFPNCIDKLGMQKSPGPYKISSRLIRKIENDLIKPLKIIFNTSLTSGQAPEK